MTIFIGNEEITEEDATKLISEPNARQIVRAWCQSDINHEFKSEESFKEAVRRNRRKLWSLRPQ